jgi:HEAT repeat protein
VLFGSRAAEALTQNGGEIATAALVAALEKEYSNTINEEIVNALVSIGSENAVNGLLSTALHHKDEETRACAAKALIEFSNEGVITAFMEALTDEDGAVRSNAAYTLGILKAEVAILELEAALNDEYANVRYRAAGALGEIGRVSSVPSLLACLEGEDLLMLGSAISALGKIGGEDAISALAPFLNSKEPQVCIITASALGKTGSESAVTLLKNAALWWIDFSPWHEWEDRLRAITCAIGDIGGDAGAYALIEILRQEIDSDVMMHFDESLRPFAAMELSKIENCEVAVEGLDEFLQIGDLQVIAGAYQYYIELGRTGSEELLIDALNKYGNKTMASKYLNCGNEKLSDAARSWAKEKGYSIVSIPGSSGGTSWGSGG